MQPKKNYIRSLVIMVSMFILIGLGLYFYRGSQFRLISTTPNLSGTVSTATSVYKLKFSRNLKENNYPSRVTGQNKDIIQSIRIDQNIMYIDLSPLDEDKEYTFSVNDIRSTQDDVIESISIYIVAKYIPFNKLSKTQQELEISQTDRNNQTDPLMEYLPYEGDRYYLEGSYSETDDGEPVFILDAQIFLLRGELLQDRNAVLDAYETKIHQYIQSKGLDPKNYPIRYDVTEPPLNIN